MKKAIVLFLTFALLLGSVFLGTAAYAGTPAEEPTETETALTADVETSKDYTIDYDRKSVLIDNILYSYHEDERGNRVIVRASLIDPALTKTSDDGMYTFMVGTPLDLSELTDIPDSFSCVAER